MILYKYVNCAVDKTNESVPTASTTVIVTIQ